MNTATGHAPRAKNTVAATAQQGSSMESATLSPGLDTAELGRAVTRKIPNPSVLAYSIMARRHECHSYLLPQREEATPIEGDAKDYFDASPAR
ncbi:MAG TPA: hypothetical protein VFW68_12950 [Rhodocyclaceae bacterium]|nr:hypothetical protein [Rhodocyclaceae bacterium]